MLEEAFSILRRVFDYLLALLILLAILKPFSGDLLAGLDLLLMATVTAAIGAFGHAKRLWNLFKPGKKAESEGL